MGKAKKGIKLTVGLVVLLALVGVYKIQSFFSKAEKKSILATSLTGKSVKDFLGQSAHADAPFNLTAAHHGCNSDDAY